MGVMADLLAPYGQALQGEPSPLMDSLGTGGGGMLQQLAMQQGGGGGVQGYSDPNANRYEQMAQQMAQNQFGWGPRQFNALDQIATAESGWNPGAVNQSSGAAGIPQMLPSAHPDINVQQFLHDPRQQIEWMLNYIHGRYGNPVNALNIRQSQGWY